MTESRFKIVRERIDEHRFDGKRRDTSEEQKKRVKAHIRRVKREIKKQEKKK